MSRPLAQLLSSARYNHPEHCKRDILNVTKYFATLKPRLEDYTFPDGLTKKLVCLNGTIPVTINGVRYNIPVGLVISDNHPFEAPLCYVRPTKDMHIKPSPHVDGSGRVYMPYLAEWNRHTSDLLSTIQVMQVLFAQRTPVVQNSPSSRAVMPPSLPRNVALPGGSSSKPAQTISMPTPPNPVYPFSSQPQPYSSTTATGTITEEHIRASLLSAVQDRLKSRMKEKVHQIQDEIEVLKKTSSDLDRGKTQLDEMKTRMAKEIEELKEAKSKLQELDDQLQEFINRYDKEEGDVNPDEIYGPTQPLFKQLLDAVAEEQAVLEAIYNTGEGLRKNVITLDVFLKGVRELSRRQFMLKALMRACRTRASLPN